jgi:Glycosyl transferase family 2/Methyltransferase domain
LNSLKPKTGWGIDISPQMVAIAKQNYPHLNFCQMDAEALGITESFDYIIVSDTVGYFEDVQKAFSELTKIASEDTRIIITYQNFLWLPILTMAEWLKLKMPTTKLNWLDLEDLTNLLNLAGWEVIKTGRRCLFPKQLPIFSEWVNKYLASLPLFNRLCLTTFVIAKPHWSLPANNDQFGVSVIIPARNEKGNIENAVKRIPQMGKDTEIIFVEGHSQDDTLVEIQRVCDKYSKDWNIHYVVQDGQGKADAVRKGFGLATGDILMILDADLTVPPEELPKFYNAIATGKGEYVNGSRLVYPMEKEAMRFLNMVANKFFSIMFSWLLGQSLKDTLCGTKVLSKRNWEKLMRNRHYFGDFDPFGDFDLIFGAAKLNLKMVEVPIHYKARQYGETNISRFQHGWLLLKMVMFALHKIKFY